MTDRLFNSPSFWTLDSAGQTAVRAYVDPDGAQPKLDARAIYLQRASLATALVDAERRLGQTNVALFPFLSSDQKKALEGELLLVFYQLSAQYKLDWVEREWEALPSRGAQLQLCADLINQLRASGDKTPEAQLTQATSTSQYHTKYLGLKLVVPVLMETMDAISSGHATRLKAGLTFINERRLYWVWGGSTIRVLLETLPASFADISTAEFTLNMIAPITGSMSWILYFTRAGIEWSRLGSHTFNFAMSKEERELGFTFKERFLTQWRIRKYALLNDSIWGLCNLACFTVLAASGPFEYWGNALTAVLLLMDVSLTWWRRQEEETAHNANLIRYQNDIDALENQIKLARRLPVGTPDAVSIGVLLESLRGVKHALFQAKLEWKYKQLATATDLAYSVSLIAAFCMLCCFFFPPAAFAPATVLILGVVGISLCFVFNLAYASTNMALDVWKSSELKQVAEEALHEQLALFIDLLKVSRVVSSDPLEAEHNRRLVAEMKQLYLTLRELRVDSRYQQDVIIHQRYQLFYSTIRDALIPPLFIAAFVFMPLGIGIPIFALGVALAVAPYFILAYSKSKLEKQRLPAFDEGVYDAFCTKALTTEPALLVGLLGSEPTKSPRSTSFFPPKPDEEPSLKEPLLIQNRLGFDG